MRHSACDSLIMPSVDKKECAVNDRICSSAVNDRKCSMKCIENDRLVIVFSSRSDSSYLAPPLNMDSKTRVCGRCPHLYICRRTVNDRQCDVPGMCINFHTRAVSDRRLVIAFLCLEAAVVI